MSKKSSVYFGPKLVAHTTGLRDGDSISARINRTAERYMAIVALHGFYLTDVEFDHVRGLIGPKFMTVEEIVEIPGIVLASESTVVDTATLADKLTAMTFADLLAAVERMGR